jgi:hypothetical protein
VKAGVVDATLQVQVCGEGQRSKLPLQNHAARVFRNIGFKTSSPVSWR